MSPPAQLVPPHGFSLYAVLNLNSMFPSSLPRLRIRILDCLCFLVDILQMLPIILYPIVSKILVEKIVFSDPNVYHSTTTLWSN